MGTPTQELFVTFAVFFLTLYLLYEVMVVKVNRQLPPNESVSLIPLRQWPRLMNEHARLYPRSVFRKIILSCAAVVLSLAALLVIAGVWVYFKG